jgi:hypothetical protein
VTFVGEVIQVLEDGLDVDLRVDVTKGPSGVWKDTIYVQYRRSSNSEPRILEGDTIRLSGDFKGLKSYEAILGQTITIPHVVASAVEPETLSQTRH